MYKIGEFSKITNLTVKTLRYYDEQGMLNPSYRNKENGYRFSDVRKYISKIYKAIKGKSEGYPFNCYHDGEYRDEADIEVCTN